MKKAFLFSTALVAALSVSAQRKACFDTDWKFNRGDLVNAEVIDYDDSRWRTLTVPHDFSMDPASSINDHRVHTPQWEETQIGPFTRLSVGDWDTGQTTGGTGWYRKSFLLPTDGGSVQTYLAQNNLNLRFDGIYNHSEVWINGVKAHVNVYGYMPFVVNLNKILADTSNRNSANERMVTVAVKAVNEGQNSRWYAGSGMFRHVWLETTDKLHLDEWDTYVNASELTGKSARVKVSATVFNEADSPASGTLAVELVDASGKVVGRTEQPFETAGRATPVATELTVGKPHLWSVDDPYRYRARVSISKSGEERDALTIPFGIRTISFSATEGFALNGVSMKLYGGCVHHDNGLLGAAAIDRAEARKVELLKSVGYNAVRASHNLPSEAFLHACDSLGLLIIDEVFDQWEESKRPNDYSQYFTRDHEKDMALMVRRDRNHPCVIMWSIGNEIAQRADVPRGREIALDLNRMANEYDGTRPTTMGVNSFWDRSQQKFTWEKDSPRAFENLGVSGYNYEWRHYEPDHEAFPDRVMFGSESYPKEMAANWNIVERHPYVIGDFVWTAIDYLGEAAIGHTYERSDRRWIQMLSWPWFNSWCGDLDITGEKKPQSYYRDVLWRRSKLAMAVRPPLTKGEYEDVSMWGWSTEENHWNFGDGYLPIEIRPENYLTANVPANIQHDSNAGRGDLFSVRVYSREPRVKLLLNDKLVGEADTNPETYTATFDVAYEPGTLKAVTVPAKKGAKAETIEFVTAKAPASVRLEADRSAISASHNDLAYVSVNVEDIDGRLCPTAEIPLEISVEGAANIIAGTGHPYDMKSFRSMKLTTFRGKALIIVQPQDKAGTVTLRVRPQGMAETAATITMQ